MFAADRADRIRLILRDAEGQPRLAPDVVSGVVTTLNTATSPGIVTIEGTAGAFCQGLPLEAIAPLLDTAPEATLREALDQYAALIEAIGRCARPVFALVDGPAFGGGLGVAAAADVVLATRRAVFGLPESLIGLIPVFAFGPVAARVGVARARLLAMGGPTVNADTALRIGLVDEVVDDLEAATARYASRLARMDARSISAVKRLVADADQCGAGYAPAARLEVLKLGATSETRARLGRLVAGDAPWIPVGAP